MKKAFSRIIALAAVLVLGFSALTGCTAPATENERTALVIDGEKIPAKELKLYLYDLQFRTERDDALMIETYYGMTVEDYWDYEWYAGMGTMRENALQTAIIRIRQTRLLNKKAKADGITLTADEQAKVKAAIDAFKAECGAVIEKSGADDALIEAYFTQNAIANKEYQAIIENISREFDPEETHRKLLAGIAISAKTTLPLPEDAAEDAEAEVIPEEEQNAKREAAKADVLKQIEAAAEPDVEAIAAAYADDQYVTVTALASPLVVKPEDAETTNTQASVYRKPGWEMSKGDSGAYDYTAASSGSVTSYVIKCLDDDYAEGREAAEELLIQDRQKAAFTEAYEKLESKYHKFYIYTDVVGNISIEEALYVNEAQE